MDCGREQQEILRQTIRCHQSSQGTGQDFSISIILTTDPVSISVKPFRRTTSFSSLTPGQGGETQPGTSQHWRLPTRLEMFRPPGSPALQTTTLQLLQVSESNEHQPQPGGSRGEDQLSGCQTSSTADLQILQGRTLDDLREPSLQGDDILKFGTSVSW